MTDIEKAREYLDKFGGTDYEYLVRGSDYEGDIREDIAFEMAAYAAHVTKELREENERLTLLLRRHHGNHLLKGICQIQSEEDGGWFEIDYAAEYTDSQLHDDTVDALK